jgi:hypothetical protein
VVKKMHFLVTTDERRTTLDPNKMHKIETGNIIRTNASIKFWVLDLRTALD